MRFAETEVAGVIVVEPDVHRDARGFFLETFHAAKYAAAGIPVDIRPGQSFVLGPRHAARPAHADPQAAGQAGAGDRGGDLGRGARRAAESPTFMRWTAATLSAENFTAALHPARLRARILRDERRGAGAVQVHRAVRSGRRDRHRVERPGGRHPWPVAEPLLSARDQANQSLREVIAVHGGSPFVRFLRRLRPPDRTAVARGMTRSCHRSESMMPLSVGLGRITAAVFTASGW